MTNESSRVSYFNTLIFTIVSGILSLLLLLSLFIDIVKEHAFYFIIAVEIGIFTVIAICIYQIVKNEKMQKNKKLDIKLSFYECPDYFNKIEENSETYCYNNYQVFDARGKSYVLRIYPESVQLPNSLPVANIDKNEKFNLYQIEQNPEFKNAKDQCAFIVAEPDTNTAISADQQRMMDQYKGYSTLPWTHAQSRCGPYVE